MASPRKPAEISSPIDFRDLAQARAWVADTVVRRPWRPAFFEAFAAALNAEPDQPVSVVELGSGPGHLAAVLLRQCRVRAYAAIDFSPAMHQLAREHLGEQAERVAFLTRDFRFPDWREGLADADAVVTMQAAHEVRHKTRLPALFENVRAALRPGGLFLFCDHYAKPGRNPELVLKRDEQPRALEAAGFAGVRVLLDQGGMALIYARRLA